MFGTTSTRRRTKKGEGSEASVFRRLITMLAGLAVIAGSFGMFAIAPAAATTSTCDKEGYTKIDQESGTADLPFGYLEWGGAGESTETTINYEVEENYTLYLCLKSSTDVVESDPIVGPVSGTFDTGDKYAISHIGYTYDYSCPDGTVWEDANDNGVEEEGECTPVGDTVPVPPNQETLDPCNPEGVTNNVTWKSALPTDTDKVDWSESNNGATRTATLKDSDDKWSDGTKAPKVWNLPADSGEKCPVTPPPPPVPPTCPNGTPWTDTNGNGMMDECNPPVVVPPVVTPPVPPVVTPPEVTPPKPVKVVVKKADKCGPNNSYYVKRVMGAYVTLFGKKVREGVWHDTKRSRLVLKAKVGNSEKFELVGKDKFVLVFSNDAPCHDTPDVTPPAGG